MHSTTARAPIIRTRATSIAIGVGDVCDLDADADLICNIGGPLASGLGLVAGVGCFPGQGSTGGFIVTNGGVYGMLPKPADNCPLHRQHQPGRRRQRWRGRRLRSMSRHPEQ